jgi:hypothetical protein
VPAAVGWEEAVHLHGAIRSDPEVPAIARDDNGSDFAADGVDAADAGEPISYNFSWLRGSLCGAIGAAWSLPDHELVVTAGLVVVRVCSRKQVIRDIGPQSIPWRVVPLDVRRHALDVRNLDALCKLLPHVRKALHVVLPALPRPLCAPAHARARRALHRRALRARAGGSFAPVVVVELVPVGGIVGVLRAEGGGLTAYWGYGVGGDGGAEGSGGGEGQEG